MRIKRLRMDMEYLFVLCVSFAIVLGQGPPLTPPPIRTPPTHPCREDPGDFKVCGVSDGDAETKLQALLDLFMEAEDNKIDLVFLVDLSQSVSTSGIQTALENIQFMLEYLASRGFIYKHYCYTRIAIVPYETVSIAAIDEVTASSSATPAATSDLTMCKLQQGIGENTLLNWKPQPSSNVDLAFQKAKEIFKGSGRDDSLKILWLYGDGDYSNAQNYTDTLHQLKSDMGVKVITAGIGERAWFRCPEHERTLQSISTNANLYACAANWTSFAQQGSYPEKDHLRAQYVPESSSDCTEQCSESCACDLKTLTFACVDQSQVDPFMHMPCLASPTTQPPPTPAVIVKNDGTLNDLIVLIVAVLASIIVVVLIVVVIFCVVIVKVRSKPKGNALPPPPVLKRMRSGKNPEQYGDEYAIYAMVGAAAAEESTMARDKNSKLERLYSEVDDLQLRFIQVDGLAAKETITVQDEVIYQKREKSLKKNEKNMKGWGVYLLDLKQEYQLQHIAVINVNQNRAAWTPSFDLPEKEVKNIRELMDNFKMSGAIQAETVTVKGVTYTLALREMSENHLYGYRVVPGASEQETAWAVRAGDYTIIAVAPESRNMECENLVHEIFRYLKVLSESTYSEYQK